MNSSRIPFATLLSTPFQRRFRFQICAAIVLPLSLALGACDSEASSGLTSDRDSELTVDGESADGEGRQRKGKRGHGPEMLLQAAVKDLDLSESQTAEVEALVESLKENRGDGHQLKHDLAQILAEGVGEGAIDSDSVNAQLDLIQSSASDNVNAIIAAINELHSILDAEQRAELVAMIQSRGKGGKGGKKGPKGERPDGEGERPDSNRSGQRPPQGERPEGPPPGAESEGVRGEGPNSEGSSSEGRGGKAGHHGPPGAHLVRALELSDEQKEALKAAMGERPDPSEREAQMQERKEKMQAMLEAFSGDSFDATSFIDASEVAQHARDRAEGFVNFVSNLMGVLNEDQQIQLATLLEEGPKKHRSPDGEE